MQHTSEPRHPARRRCSELHTEPMHCGPLALPITPNVLETPGLGTGKSLHPRLVLGKKTPPGCLYLCQTGSYHPSAELGHPVRNEHGDVQPANQPHSQGHSRVEVASAAKERGTLVKGLSLEGSLLGAQAPHLLWAGATNAFCVLFMRKCCRRTESSHFLPLQLPLRSSSIFPLDPQPSHSAAVPGQ